MFSVKQYLQKKYVCFREYNCFSPNKRCINRIMTRFRFFLILGSLAFSFPFAAQNMAAYSDYKNYFFVFDDGAATELEYLPVKSSRVGGNAVAYVDNNGNFKVFNKGKITTLSETTVSNYVASDYLVSYSSYQFLYVFDNGRDIQLSKYAVPSYSTGDSVVAFLDSRAYALKVYYNGNITSLEEGSDPPVLNFVVGDNVVAYINYLNEFKVFYRGKSIKLATVSRSLPYKAGKDILAYYNDNYGFSIFHKWLIYDMEKFQPKSFAVGDGMAAYVTPNEEFKVFYDGKMKLLGSFEPTFYNVSDSLVVYNDAQKFKVFYKGTVYTLENFIPTEYYLDLSTIAYLDQQGRLKTFHSGKTEMVTHSAVDEFHLYRNVISYRVLNRNYMYYKSRVYTQ